MKLLLLSMAVFTYGVAFGQDIPAGEVPSVVVNTLKSKFTNATDLDWEKKNGQYEADFEVNKVDYTALIDASGKLIKFKQEISNAALPAAITSAIASQYKGFKVDDAEKIEHDGKTYYQIDLDGKPRDQKIVLNSDGTVATGVIYW